ncbi:MAG: hypothetical protein ACD_44C00099G0005 [uncultured bacterium]|nr:MAG: hypothetical protein ACD_44C00099G0005 [uncultured bacterium]OGT15689.1 MAG: hypothetical protein A3B69_03455 [Gammaproteobacteria bacterium RIFCSPHIGHO2_02_FULL_38_33]
MKKVKKISKFKTSSSEDKFWQNHDSTAYINWDHAKKTKFPNLKPSTKVISLRLPERLLNEIKILANKEDIPYQSLMKILLTQAINIHRK